MTNGDVGASDLAVDDCPAAIRYEQDSYGWALQQIAHLRAGDRAALDLPHLAQTLAGITLQERVKLKGSIEEVLQALLKWDQAPDARLRAWSLTIHQQRRRLGKQIRRQPGLLAEAPELLADAYALARGAVLGDLRLDDDGLPRVCPYTWDEVTGREIAWLEA